MWDRIGSLLTVAWGREVAVRTADPVHGGSINEAWRIGTEAGPCFLKLGVPGIGADIFGEEAEGLEMLRASQAVHVPGVIAHGVEEDRGFLLLEYVERGEDTSAVQAGLGQAMARLHQHAWSMFGLEKDNHIGLLPQVNTPHAEWSDFLVHCRFGPLVRRAMDHGRIDSGDVLRFERLYRALPDLFPKEPPALLHGDLWRNNWIASADGRAVLVDPAVYYGHREMDLAMSRLFGGFGVAFHAAYEETAPLATGWEERVDLCNLYPLLVHLNLFGGTYRARLSSVLRRYV